LDRIDLLAGGVPTDDVAVLATGLTTVPVLCLQLSVLLSCLVYLGWLSFPLFLATSVILPIGFSV